MRTMTAGLTRCQKQGLAWERLNCIYKIYQPLKQKYGGTDGDETSSFVLPIADVLRVNDGQVCRDQEDMEDGTIVFKTE